MKKADQKHDRPGDYDRGDQLEAVRPKKPLDIPVISTVRHFELPARYNNNPGEAHFEYEFIYVEKGIFLEMSESEPVVMHAGDAVIYGKHYFHKTICDGKHSADVFVTTFECNSALMAKAFPTNTRTFVRITPEQRNILALAFAAGIKAYDTNAHLCSTKKDPPYINRQIYINYIEILFLQIIHTLNEEKAKEKIFFACDEKHNELTKTVIAFLKSRVYSDVTIDEICRHTGYSSGHICSLFKKDTGRTVNNYYQLLKIEEAKRLILETNQDFGTISEELGYNNSQYFSKVFRQYTGYSPGNFRKTIFKGALETEN